MWETNTFTLTTVAVAALGLGAAALKLAQMSMKNKNGKNGKDNSAGGQLTSFWIIEIGRIFDEKMKPFVAAQEKDNERTISDLRNLLTARDERLIPLLDELRKIGQQQVEIQQKQNEILVELVTVSRIGRRP